MLRKRGKLLLKKISYTGNMEEKENKTSQKKGINDSKSFTILYHS